MSKHERVCKWCGKVHSTPKMQYCSEECTQAMYEKKTRLANERYLKNREINSYYLEDGKLIRAKTSTKNPKLKPWDGKLPEIVTCTLKAY